MIDDEQNMVVGTKIVQSEKHPLFRLWVIISVLWVSGMTTYQYQDFYGIGKESPAIAAKELKHVISNDSKPEVNINDISQNREGGIIKLKTDSIIERVFQVIFMPFFLLILYRVGVVVGANFEEIKKK